MNKLLVLVNALNAVSGNVDLREGDILYQERDKEGKVTAKFVVKLRPVANDDGVESFKYVARMQKD